jgi:hypothetical protein
MLDTTSAWKESTQEELVVDVEADGYECFKFMLQYMYTGTFPSTYHDSFK